MKFRRIIYLLLLFSLLAVFYIFKNYILINNPGYKIYFTLFLFCIYFILVLFLRGEKKLNMGIILIAAILARLIFFDDQLAGYSGDANRYIWDGKVQSQGINPYLYSPNSNELSEFRDKYIYSNINNKSYKTIYPPLAQIIFYVSYLIKANSFYTLKFIYLFFEIIAVIFLFLLTRTRNNLLIHLLCPLVILETYLGMHLDIIGVTFLLGTIYFFQKEKYYVFILFLAGSVLIKYITLVLIPLFLMVYYQRLSVKGDMNKSQIVRDILIKGLFFFMLIILFYLPYIKAGYSLFESFFLYSRKWTFNSFIHKFFMYIFGENGRIYSGVLLLIILGLIYFKLRVHYIVKIELALISTLLLNNALFPGYLIWIVPFLVFNQRISIFFLVGIISISFHVFIKYKSTGIWDENIWILYIQYVPFYILFIYELIKGSYAKQFKNSRDHAGIQ